MIARRCTAERLYALLLRALPADFRRRFGEAMQDHFRDTLRECRQSSGGHGVAFAIRTLADLAATAISEWATAFAAVISTVFVTAAHFPAIGKKVMLISILDDLRYAIRFLAKTPVFTLVAVAVIALGTGAVSTIFSVANSILLRPIPGISAAENLVWIGRTGPKRDGNLSASYVYLEQLSTNSRTVQGIAGWAPVDLTVRASGEPQRAFGNIVSGNFFEVLGARPFLGRFFSHDEGSAENTFPVAVVSHGFWQREMHADSAAVGRTMLVNGRSYTVIGVATPGFTGLYPMLRTDVWVPVMMHAALRPHVGNLRDPKTAWLELVGRVGPNVSLKQAEAELSTLTTVYALSEKGSAPEFASINQARVVRWTGLPVDASTGVTAFLGVLLAVSGMVLLIASLNVASMHLARAVSRRREIAVRLALGATTSRLIRQLLTESVLLFVIGGAFGVFVAITGTRLLGRIDLPVDVPLQIEIAPDTRVMVFTLLLALVTGVVFGVAPAARSTRVNLNLALRSEGGGAGRRRSRLRNALIVSQVAFSLVLLAAAGLFTRALGKGRSVELGFRTDHVMTAALNVSSSGYDETRARTFYSQLADRLRHVSGVDAVGYTRVLPLSMSSMGTSISMPNVGPPGGKPGTTLNVSFGVVDEGYFSALRLPLVDGRDFAANDVAGAPRVAVVNQAFSRTHLGGRSPVGLEFTLDGSTVTIVGVAKDSKYRDLSEPLVPFVYLDQRQSAVSATTLLVRSSLDRATVSALVRREIQALDRNLPPPAITTLQQGTDVSLLPQRAAAGVTGTLGGLGLILAAVGLYGVLAFSAAQRTRELGVRLALGARPADLRRMIVREGMRLVAFGSAIGLVLTLVGMRALVPFLFGLNPLDPVTFVFVISTLAAAALLASYLPARRAAAADPMVSLRQE